MNRILNSSLAGALLLTFGIFAVSCTGDQAPAEEADAAAESQAEATSAPPTAFVYIQHPVEDFDAWLPYYDGFADERAANQVAEVWVYRDLDQTNVVHALHGAADVATLRAFTEMESLASAMQEAGVVGPPRFDFMNLVVETAPETPVASQYSVLIRHDVADWDAWKAAFDGHAPAREAAGLTSRGVGRGADNPNNVYINFAVSDLDAARAFVASEDLRSTMEAAGVVGTPEIYFTETVRPAM